MKEHEQVQADQMKVMLAEEAHLERRLERPLLGPQLASFCISK